MPYTKKNKPSFLLFNVWRGIPLKKTKFFTFNSFISVKKMCTSWQCECKVSWGFIGSVVQLKSTHFLSNVHTDTHGNSSQQLMVIIVVKQCTISDIQLALSFLFQNLKCMRYEKINSQAFWFIFFFWESLRDTNQREKERNRINTKNAKKFLSENSGCICRENTADTSLKWLVVVVVVVVFYFPSSRFYMRYSHFNNPLSF